MFALERRGLWRGTAIAVQGDAQDRTLQKRKAALAARRRQGQEQGPRRRHCYYCCCCRFHLGPCADGEGLGIVRWHGKTGDSSG